MLRGTAQLGSGPLSSPEQLALTLPQREALQVQLRSASVGVMNDAPLGVCISDLDLDLAALCSRVCTADAVLRLGRQVSPLRSPSAQALFADFNYVSPDYSPGPASRPRRPSLELPILDLSSA